MNGSPADAEHRILVVAPFGRDAQVTCEVLGAAGLACEACATLEDLGRELARGAGALLVTTEALATPGSASLQRILEAQEPWSDVPVVLAAEQGRPVVPDLPIARFGRAGAVTVLERPIRTVTLLSVARAALRARRRQYDLRDALAQLREHVHRLDAERIVRERFVSVLAHDLRGPLSAAGLTAQMVLDHPERAAQRPELAVRLRRNLQRMDHMIRDLLDANRIRAGERLPIEVQRSDLKEVVLDALADLDDAARARVRVSAPDRLEGRWAPDQLRRAAWNLVSNALKYGAPDQPVEVTLTRAEDGVALSVHNAGPAIPLAEQQRIFEPFGRASGAEARARGWGLGLTLVRGCAEAHGGAVEVASSPEAGTTFTLRLPVDGRPASPAGP